MFERWLVACPHCRRSHIHIPHLDADRRACVFCEAPIDPGAPKPPSLRPPASGHSGRTDRLRVV